MYQFEDTAENVGSPEVQSEVFEIGTRLLDLMEEHNPDRGYAEHNERVLDIISDHAPEEMDTDSGLMQHVVAIHDAVAHLHQTARILDSDKEHQPDDTTTLIMDELSSWFRKPEVTSNPQSSRIVRNAIAVSISAELLEHKSSEWRKRFFGENNQEVDRETLNSRPGIVSLEELVEATDEYDIEAFILKTAELVDNLRNPNRTSKIGQFEDAIELNSFYVPALEILGFDHLASLANDEALQYLNGAEYRGLMSEAKSRQAIASQNCSQLLQVVEDALATELEDDSVTLTYRVKSLGSTLDKLRQLSLASSTMKLDEDSVAMSDQIGLRIVFEDIDTLKDLVEHDRTLHSYLLDVDNWKELMPNVIGVELHHPRSEAKQVMIGQKARPNGYEAIHTTYRLTFGNGKTMNFEVQTLNREMEDYNNSAANHALYKTTHTESMLGNAIKKLKAKGPHRLEEHEIQIFREAIELITNAQSRADFYRERERWMARVNPRSIFRAAKTLSKLPEGDKIAGSWNVLLEMCKHCELDDAPEFSGFAIDIETHDFVQLLSDIRPDLFENEDTRMQLESALGIAEAFHGQLHRRNGSNAFNGHILPAALAFSYDRALKDRFEFTPEEVDSICVLILHDFLEDVGEYAEEYEDIIDSFFRDMPSSVINAVIDMTKPSRDDSEGIDSDERERRYIDNVAKSGRLMEKFFDRAQNIYTDIETLRFFTDALEGGPPVTLTEMQDFVELQQATARYWLKSQHLFNYLVLNTAIESPRGQILYDQSTSAEDNPTQVFLQQNLTRLFMDYTNLMKRTSPIVDRFAANLANS